jgi:hypothetical protein
MSYSSTLSAMDCGSVSVDQQNMTEEVSCHESKDSQNIEYENICSHCDYFGCQSLNSIHSQISFFNISPADDRMAAEISFYPGIPQYNIFHPPKS